MNSEKKGVKGETRLIVALILTAVFCIAATVECLAVDVSLDWNNNTEDDLVGYKLYYKADSSTLPFNGMGATEGNSPIDVGMQTTATLHNLDPAHDWYFRVTAYDKSGNESGYSDAVNIKESVAPKVSLTAPVKNSTVHGTVAIIARASDKSGVTKVDFYVNDDLKGTDNEPPYSYSWDSRSVDNGPYTLYAKAYDGADNVRQSAAVKVKVKNDKTAPIVNIASPQDGSTVKGTVIVKARATDNMGVTKVEFYVNGVLKKTDKVAPYRYSWDTGSVANGENTLIARAYDKAGNMGEFAVTVTVNNSN
jgi:chitinase